MNLCRVGLRQNMLLTEKTYKLWRLMTADCPFDYAYRKQKQFCAVVNRR
jgi:hypothetical protein